MSRRCFAQDIHLLVVAGVGGDEEHVEAVQQLVDAVVDAAKKQGVLDGQHHVSRRERRTERRPHEGARHARERDQGVRRHRGARQSRTTRSSCCSSATAASTASTAAFNLPGPDLTRRRLRDAARPLHDAARRVREHREFERRVPRSRSAGRRAPSSPRPRPAANATKRAFPQYFVEALGSEAADRDRNGRVSVQEAFDYAGGKVKAAYEQGGHILTEHATLDDGSEGKLASTLYPGAGAVADARPRRSPTRRCARCSSSATRSSVRSTTCGCKKDSMPAERVRSSSSRSW